jgi:uncharacterized protein (TIGR02271 family)
MAEPEEVASIPLVEERIEVSTKEVETGRLRVRISVGERQEQVAAELSRDEVEIRRVPRNEALSEIPAVRTEGDLTIIPVVEEQLVVEKRLVLVEEIHVVRRTETESREIPVILRSEQADIEREREGAAATGARWRPS